MKKDDQGRVVVEPTTTCIVCGAKVFCWDDHCVGCGLEFGQLMVIANKLKGESPAEESPPCTKWRHEGNACYDNLVCRQCTEKCDWYIPF